MYTGIVPLLFSTIYSPTWQHCLKQFYYNWLWKKSLLIGPLESISPWQDSFAKKFSFSVSSLHVWFMKQWVFPLNFLWSLKSFLLLLSLTGCPLGKRMMLCLVSLWTPTMSMLLCSLLCSSSYWMYCQSSLLWSRFNSWFRREKAVGPFGPRLKCGCKYKSCFPSL